MEEPFTLIEESRPSPDHPHHLFNDFVTLGSAPTADHDLQYAAALRAANPDMIVTGIPASNIPLRVFAAAGFAACERDTATDGFWAWRGYVASSLREKRGGLAETVFFAKYHYRWGGEDFVLYTVGAMQYVLKERRDGENAMGPSATTDALIKTVGDWIIDDDEVVWVFDGYWTRSKNLYQEVMKASWDKVILNEDMKKELTGVASKFFTSKSIYEDLGVPWKRGLLFHGPPGNGKTISIKALMHTLLDYKKPIPTLYVRSAPYTYMINNVFALARRLSPCMLVLEDIETIVTPQTRSYFFNEMDGLENNDGLFIVGSTNFLERLDPGLSKRPSRFDRKYLFPLPSEHERTLYCEYWREKLRNKPAIEFPKKLCPEMARITPGFSFAFLQECFVATLLVMARHEDEKTRRSSNNYYGGGGGKDDLDDYQIWRVFKEQADILRKEVESQRTRPSPLMEWCRKPEGSGRAAASPAPLPALLPPTQTHSHPHHAQPLLQANGQEPCRSCGCSTSMSTKKDLSPFALTTPFEDLALRNEQHGEDDGGNEYHPDLPPQDRKFQTLNSTAWRTTPP